MSVLAHISRSKFIGGASITGGSIFINGLSNVYFSGSIFTDNSAKYSGGAIHAQNYMLVSLENSFFEDNYATHKGSEFYGLYGNITKFTNVKISRPSNSTSIFLDTCSLITNNLQISDSNDFASYAGGISCFNCLSISISKSSFKNLFGK